MCPVDAEAEWRAATVWAFGFRLFGEAHGRRQREGRTDH
jgi:hypothetical protein